MLLYYIDVQIRHGGARFRLEIEGDDRFSEDGDWTVSSPGHLYLAVASGYWRLHRPEPGKSGAFWLDSKRMPGGWSLIWGASLPKDVAVLWIDKMGAILDQRAAGGGEIGIRSGEYDFDWAVTRRFI